MITVMRRYRKSLQLGLLVIIAAFVASLFVFGATGSRFGGGGETRDSVATVNGETIFSKLQTGKFPDEQWAVDAVGKKLK